MMARVVWAFLALSCVRGPSTVVAQNLEYQFTMSVTSPAPVPGKPFTLTWTGGESTEAVYIVLNNYFPDTPNQNIVYGGTDILSNAPNNGSWTYNVPLNIEAGRHSFSIGYNPLMLSDQTDIFTILSSQTSYVVPGPSTTNTAVQTYNGCGLPPLPDYTYTGYQTPCATTINGQVETLYPIVPASDSSSFYGVTQSAYASPTSTVIPSDSTSANTVNTVNTAFATGVYAQALQCSTPVTPSTTEITSSGATTILSLAVCTPRSELFSNNNHTDGVCHTSGYTTFSVSGTSSVCCPTGWATTPLNSELFCFTSIGQNAKRVIGERQASTVTLGADSSSTLVSISGLVFTSAGIVTAEAAVQTESSSTTSGSSASKVTSAATMSAQEPSPTKSGSGKWELGLVTWVTGATMAMLCIMQN